MVLHVNLKSMPKFQTWSYTKTHIGILCLKLSQFQIISFYSNSPHFNII
ncbi:hypothetical protein F383_37569 [Gossypium arboreum]|uniref:Uncharacterized protein n=1 Tax=Gossypium arboreum TaxID=29729 RepID=A0A0B0MDA6_GOSAR|nr:hypothetical protein F383_37569 [Gossypium arboreum]